MTTHIVVVNYHTSAHVAHLLDSPEVRGATRIVIADNASGGGEGDKLRAVIADQAAVSCVWLETNRGFAAGVHAGIDALNADPSDRIWILNPDTVPRHGSRAALEAALAHDPTRIVSPVIVTGAPEKETVWFAGGDVDLTSGRTTHQWHGTPYMQFRRSVEANTSTGFISGAAPMMTLATWQRLHGFDRRFFMYWEDADFSLRASREHIPMNIVSDAVVWHAVGAASAETGKSALYYYYMHRNRIRVLRRYSSRRRPLLSAAALIETTKLIRRAVLETQRPRIKIVWSLRGIADGLTDHDPCSDITPAVTVWMNKDLAEWNQRYQRGDVPSPSPYGLQNIAEDTRWHTIRPGSPARTAVGVARRLTASLRRADTVDHTIVTWDERAALRAWATSSARSRITGVIWILEHLDDTGIAAVLRRHAIRRTLRSSTAVWVLSRAQVQPLTTWLGLGAPPVEYVSFGIDTDFFPARDIGTEQLVVSFGRDRDRDLHTLLKAFEVVLETVPTARFIVQGTWSEPVHPHIEIVDTLSHNDIRDLYGRSRVVAVATHPNTHVSGMTVALEAMCVGRPVVVSSTPGMEDYVLDGVTGTICECADVAGMADAVIEFLLDDERSVAVGSAAAEHVRRRHRLDNMTSSLCALIAGSSRR